MASLTAEASAFSVSSSSSSSAATPAAAQAKDKVLSLDHLVFVVPDLAEAMDEMEERTGVRPALGGKHTTLGTHNAFLSVGDGSYIELFAPDPDATVPLKNLIGVDGPKPRLSTYCCHAGFVGIDNLVSKLSASKEHASLFPSEVEAGSRTNDKDGSLISWKVAVDRHSVPSSDLPLDGLLPFFIDWGDCYNVRPGLTAPTGCTLKHLTAYHPDPARVQSALHEIGHGIENIVTVKEGPKARLVATLDTPKGEVEIA